MQQFHLCHCANLVFTFAFLLTPAAPLNAASTYTQPFSLAGLGSSLQVRANYGAGITFGLIDTGVQARWIGYQNRISPYSACTIAGCGNSLAVNDDNGHGNFIASEIIGNVAGKYVGFAPAATLIAVKALSSSGSGHVNDVANGIRHAAGHGAKVLNLSLSLVPTQAMIDAINHAAASGAVIVFAGGNNGAIFNKGKNISGLTDTAIQNLIITGSAGASKSISYFSSKPGAGGFVSTSGRFYSFASRWMVANGEAVYGASTKLGPSGYTYLTSMTGTSMTAPQASGAAGLLAARWPFLINKGTVANILLEGSQDLGSAGIDAVYGTGFLRIDRAFQPMGALTVPVFGIHVPVTEAKILATGQLSTTGVYKALQKGVAFDKYGRDFSMDLASGITLAPPSMATGQVFGRSVTGSATGRRFTDLGNGRWLTTAFSGASVTDRAPVRPGGASRFLEDPTRPQKSVWAAGFSTGSVYLGAGSGGGAAASFNDARWNGKTAFFDTGMAGAASLLDLNPGGGYATAGLDLDMGRLSFSVMTGADKERSILTGNRIAAQGFALGYSFAAAQDLDVSLTTSILRETNALLGSASGGYLKLAEDANSYAFGLSANYDLGGGLQLGLDATLVSTVPSGNAKSLVTKTSRLNAAGFGVALRKENLTGAGDTFTASIRAPLRVFSGHARLSVPVGADPETGDPVIRTEKASLVPDGFETGFALGYARPLDKATTLRFDFAFRNDADNIRGAKDHAALLRLTRRF